MKFLIPALIFVLLSACSTTGIVKLDQDTYMVSKKRAKVGSVTAAEEKAYVYKEASRFCSEENKEVQTINLKIRNSGFARPASATLEFKCIQSKT